MDIRVFKTFIAVANLRHFGHAAETLYITPAAVSARIKQLEEHYRAQLIVRDKSNLRLTAEGEALLPFAQQLVEQLTESEHHLKQVNKQKPTINIAATPNVWDAFLSSRIQPLVQGLKDFVVGTEISVREAIQRKIAEKSLDIGLLTDPIKDEEFECELIGHFTLALVGTKPTLNNNDEGYVFVDWGLTFQKEHATYHKLTPSFKTTTAKIAQEFIDTNGGFAYLPMESVSDNVAAGKYHLIETELQIQRPIYCVTRAGNGHLFNLEVIKQALDASSL